MFNPVINPFSKYADKTEKKVDKILGKTALHGKEEIQNELLKLIQKNLVVVNLWLEHRFKGYKYLTKSRRKKFYQNTALIVAEFNKFESTFKFNEKQLFDHINKLGYMVKSNEEKNKIKHLYSIMSFLKPGKLYNYLEGASFGKLLTDITTEKMIGDCNQIVTFYIFLYALKYPVTDLQIKLLPGHVCLRFNKIDIEATNATFHNYEEHKKILPVIELITTNLLDTCDYRDKTLRIDSRSYVKAAELAYRLSDHNQIVNKNLRIAYHNLAVESAAGHNYKTAKFFAAKTNDPKLKKHILENAVIYLTQKNKFKKAYYYSSLLQDGKSKKYVRNHEAWYYFKKKNYKKALKLYRMIPDPKMIKACYGEMYNKIQKRVANIKKVTTHRAHLNDYNKMIDLAGKMEDYELEHKLKKFVKSIKST